MNYSQITEHLFIGTTPRKKDYDALRSLGVELVINMRAEYRLKQDTHPSPLKLLWLPSFDTVFIPLSLNYLQRGAKAALETIDAGKQVYVHCAYGIHRSVAMGACILIAQGYNASSAMQLIKEKRPIANPYTYYIHKRILKFEQSFKNSE